MAHAGAMSPPRRQHPRKQYAPASHAPPETVSAGLGAAPGATPDDIFVLARAYERRDRHADAADLYRDAAMRGHLGAMVAYAGHLVGFDDRAAYAWFRAAAERGEGRAWGELGQMFARGYGVPPDPAQAAACWKRAAQLDDAVGKCCLGLCYIRGFGVRRDAGRGVEIVRQVADSAGDVTAMKNLAWVYRTGRDVAKNYQEAQYWENRAKEQEKRLRHIASRDLVLLAAPDSSPPSASTHPESRLRAGHAQRSASRPDSDALRTSAVTPDVQPSSTAHRQGETASLDIAPPPARTTPSPPQGEDPEENRLRLQREAEERRAEVAAEQAARDARARQAAELARAETARLERQRRAELHQEKEEAERREQEEKARRIAEDLAEQTRLRLQRETEARRAGVLSEQAAREKEARERSAADARKRVAEELRAEQARIAAENSRRHAAEEEARLQREAAEEETRARLAAKAEERRLRLAAEEEERVRLAAAEDERARLAAEEEERVRLAAEEEERVLLAAEEREHARRAAEEQARLQAAAEEEARLQRAAEVERASAERAEEEARLSRNREAEALRAAAVDSSVELGHLQQRRGAGPVSQGEEHEPIQRAHGVAEERYIKDVAADAEEQIRREQFARLAAGAAVVSGTAVAGASTARIPGTESSEDEGEDEVVEELVVADSTVFSDQHTARDSVPHMQYRDGVGGDGGELDQLEEQDRMQLQQEDTIRKLNTPTSRSPDQELQRRTAFGHRTASLSASPSAHSHDSRASQSLHSAVSSSSYATASQPVYMSDLHDAFANYPTHPENPAARHSLYHFLDTVQKLRQENKEENMYIIERNGFSKVVMGTLAQTTDACIQERGLHALIRLLRFMPRDQRESAVLSSYSNCVAKSAGDRPPMPMDSEGDAKLDAKASGVIQAVVLAMRSHPNVRLVQMAGCAVWTEFANVSPACRMVAHELGAVPLLVGALRLRGSDMTCVLYELACRAVSSFCSGTQTAVFKEAFAQEGAVEQVVMGLERWGSRVPTDRNNNMQFVGATKNGCAALRHMATGCEEAGRRALNASAPRQLTRVMNAHTEDVAICTLSVSALTAIALANGEKAEMDLRGVEAMPVVFKAIETHSSHTLLVRKGLMCVETFGAYPSMQREVGENGGVNAAVNVMRLHPVDARVQEEACSVIERLCRKCLASQQKAAASNVVHYLSTALQMHGGDVGVCERACMAVASVTAGHPVNQNSALQAGITNLILKALTTHGAQSPKLVVAASDAMTSLVQARDPVLGQKLVRQQAPELLLVAMRKHAGVSAVQKHGSSTLTAFCITEPGLHTRLADKGVVGLLLGALKTFVHQARVVVPIVMAIRTLVSKVYRVRRKFMTDRSVGASLPGLLHTALSHHMHALPENDDLVVTVCATLNFLAFEQVPHKNAIGESGIIEQLRDLIENSSMKGDAIVLQPTLATVCTLLLNAEENKDRFQAVGGVELILSVMQKWQRDTFVLEHCCIALRYSCSRHVGNRDDVKKHNGIRSLLGTMQVHSDDPHIAQMCCQTLAVFCKDDDEVQESAGIIQGVRMVVQAMNKFEDDSVMLASACNFLFAACANCENNQHRVVRLGGRTAIIKAIESHPENLDLSEVGAYALLVVQGVGSEEYAGNERESASSGGLLRRLSRELRRSTSASNASNTPSRSRRSSKAGSFLRKSKSAKTLNSPPAAGSSAGDARHSNVDVEGEGGGSSRLPRRMSSRGRSTLPTGDSSPAQQQDPEPKKKRSLLRFGRSRSNRKLNEPEVEAAEEEPSVQPQLARVSGTGYEDEGVIAMAAADVNNDDDDDSAKLN